MKIEIGPYPQARGKRKGKGRRKPKPKLTRDVTVEIHDYDTWSADHTLALIIAPLLRHYRDKAGGAGSIGSTSPADFPDIGDPDDTHDPERWRKLLDELVWTFDELAKEGTIVDDTNERIDNGLHLFGKYYRSLWT